MRERWAGPAGPALEDHLRPGDEWEELVVDRRRLSERRGVVVDQARAGGSGALSLHRGRREHRQPDSQREQDEETPERAHCATGFTWLSRARFCLRKLSSYCGRTSSSTGVMWRFSQARSARAIRTSSR